MKKQIIVTTSWDDGHKLDLKLAKLLKKYEIAATFYISPENNEFKKQELLSNKDIKNLSKNFEIGAHTMTHPHLTKVSGRKAKKEIEKSKKYLEKVIGKKIYSFCYPYGEYNLAVKKIVKDSGFKLARTVKRFKVSNGSDMYGLPTTAHVYTHLGDLVNTKVVLTYKTNKWEVIAKKQFDYVLKNGGVFHLWGHSWEIEKFNQWKMLENLLKYIGNKKNIKYVQNAEVIK